MYAPDRSELNRALAKAIAFKQVGKDDEAESWARKLVRLLELDQVLAPAPTSAQPYPSRL